MNGAVRKLRDAQARTGSLLSAGLEPCREYLPGNLKADANGYGEFMRSVIEGTAGRVCAYKFNLAFFEALGRDGWAMMHDVRAAIPEDAFVIADAKRGDIGSSAKRYAEAVYDSLGADAVTINPLMGRDSAEPFLEYGDKLNIFLCLTSNPGAENYLAAGDLYLRIARDVATWSEGAGNCALVVGATNGERIAAVREAAPTLPFLVPGLGAQGGDVAATIRNGRMAGDFGGLILHVTRGVLPGKDDTGDAREVMGRKTDDWNARIAEAAGRSGVTR